MAKGRMPRGGGADGGHASASQVVNPFSLGAPVAMGLGMLVAGVLVRHYLAHDQYAVLWGVMIVVCLAGLVYGVHRVYASGGTDKRSQLARWLAVVGSAGGSVWILLIAELPGPLSWRPFLLFVAPWIVITTVQWFLSVARADAKAAAEGWESPTDRLKGPVGAISSINRIETVDGSVVRGQVNMEAGETVSELRKHTPEIASLLDVREGAVKIFEDPNSARRGRIEVRPVDQFAKPQQWPGPFGPGGPRAPGQLRSATPPAATLADAIVYGPSGSQYWLIGDERVGRNASMIQVVGMNGSGKSVFLQLMGLGILARGAEARYYYCDGRKADQQPPWFLAGADEVYKDNKSIIKFLQRVRAEWVPPRVSALGGLGLSQWVPGCGLPHITLIVDEALSFGQDAARVLSDLAETVRSVGIVLVVGLQQARSTRWPTDVRSQFGTAVTFGVKTADDSDMSLSELQADAGCAPHLWGNNHPGKHFLDGPGMEDDDRIRERRTYKPDKALFEEWARFFLAGRSAVPDPTVLQAARRGPLAAGGVYVPSQNGVGRRPAGYAPGDELADDEVDEGWDEEGMDEDAEVFGGEPEGEVVDLDGDEDEALYAAEAALAEAGELDDEDCLEEYDDALDEELYRPPADPQDVAEAAACEAPMEPLPGDFVMRGAPKMSEATAQAYLVQFIGEERAKGRAELRAAELDDVLVATGMGSSWLRKWLDRIATEPQFRDLGLRKLGPRLGYSLEPPARALTRA